MNEAQVDLEDYEFVSQRAAWHKMRQQKGFAMSTPKISFEFFPPKTLEASFKLWEAARALAPLAPDFVSVT